MATLVDDLMVVVHESRQAGIRPDIIRIKLKEKLQTYALDFVYNHKKYNSLILYGGTCLRKCFNTSRMSEDLDFEVIGSLDKAQLSHDIKNYFYKRILYNDVSTHIPGSGINRVELRFPVINQLGISPHAAEKLIVKIEVNPVEIRYPTEFKTFSEDRFSFVVRHYDLPTLMAGKMTACLERIYEKGTTGIKIKGRDFYDLIWYMQKGIMPNALRLANAKGKYTVKSAFERLAEKISKITPRALSIDLDPLFEDGRFIKTWISNFHDEFNKLYSGYQGSF